MWREPTLRIRASQHHSIHFYMRERVDTGSGQCFTLRSGTICSIRSSLVVFGEQSLGDCRDRVEHVWACLGAKRPSLVESGNTGADTCWLPLVINQLVGVCGTWRARDVQEHCCKVMGMIIVLLVSITMMMMTTMLTMMVIMMLMKEDVDNDDMVLLVTLMVVVEIVVKVWMVRI